MSAIKIKNAQAVRALLEHMTIEEVQCVVLLELVDAIRELPERSNEWES